MVYSAMKLFMEINPTLFDECTSEYATIQENLPQRQLERETVWKQLEEKAAAKRKLLTGVKSADKNGNGRAGSPMQLSDDYESESKRDMEKLKIGSPGGGATEDTAAREGSEATAVGKKAVGYA